VSLTFTDTFNITGLELLTGVDSCK